MNKRKRLEFISFNARTIAEIIEIEQKLGVNYERESPAFRYLNDIGVNAGDMLWDHDDEGNSILEYNVNYTELNNYFDSLGYLEMLREVELLIALLGYAPEKIELNHFELRPTGYVPPHYLKLAQRNVSQLN